MLESTQTPMLLNLAPWFKSFTELQSEPEKLSCMDPIVPLIYSLDLNICLTQYIIQLQVVIIISLSTH